MNLPILSVVLFAPLVGALLVLITPREDVKTIRRVGGAVAFLTLILATIIWIGVAQAGADGMQFAENQGDPHRALGIVDPLIHGEFEKLRQLPLRSAVPSGMLHDRGDRLGEIVPGSGEQEGYFFFLSCELSEPGGVGHISAPFCSPKRTRPP